MMHHPNTMYSVDPNPSYVLHVVIFNLYGPVLVATATKINLRNLGHFGYGAVIGNKARRTQHLKV